MNDILGLILLVLFGGAGLIAIFIIVNLSLPAPIERARAALESGLGRSLLLGLVNSLFAGLLIVLFSLPVKGGGVIAGVFAFLIGLILLFVAALTLVGLAAAVSMLADRIGGTDATISKQIRGGILLILAGLTPYLGWFAFTPLVLWTAFGASLQALFRRKEKVTETN